MKISYFRLILILVWLSPNDWLKIGNWGRQFTWKWSWNDSIHATKEKKWQQNNGNGFKKNPIKQNGPDSVSAGQSWQVLMRKGSLGQLADSKRDNKKKIFWIHERLNIKVQIQPPPQEDCAEYYWNCRLGILSQCLYHCLLWDESFLWASVTILLKFSWW